LAHCTAQCLISYNICCVSGITRKNNNIN
jgi:hypothetical protein